MVARAQAPGKRGWLLGALGVGTLCLAAGALAQPLPPQPGGWGMSGWGTAATLRGTAAPVSTGRLSLLGRVGVQRAETLLSSPSWQERVRGVERLAADGGEEAVRALAKTLEPGTEVQSHPRSRLAAVRALAPHALTDEAQKALSQVFAGTTRSELASPLDDVARATAALALAKAGATPLTEPEEEIKPEGDDDDDADAGKADDEEEAVAELTSDDDGDGDGDGDKKKDKVKKSQQEKAITPLVAAVINGGALGDMARAALLAYPPSSLAALLRGKRTLPFRVLELMGDLGDARVIGTLRRHVSHKNDAVKSAAGIALAKLGDANAARYARAWLDHKDAPEGLRVAAIEVLMLLDTKDAAGHISKLLAKAATRAQGFRLARRSLAPALLSTLSAVTKADVSDAERALAAALVARIGGSRAPAVLTALLANPLLTTSAAFGLARMDGPNAAQALAQALAATGAGAPRRLVARAAVVRWLYRGETVAGLEPALAAMFASKDPADRAVGAFGLALLGKQPLGTLLQSKQPEVVYAAARAALSMGPVGTGRLAALLGRSLDEPSTANIAGGAALLLSGEAVPSARLLAWALAGGPLAPLAAYRLAARDPRPMRARLVEMLQGGDPIVRLHIALGLARSPEADAVSLLLGAYDFESDVRVRRAVVRALSQRPEKLRRRTLERARDFDPDPWVRGAAGSALAGRKHAPGLPPVGREVTWVSLRANDEAQLDAIRARPAQVIRGDGLSLPLISDPDGVILVGGLDDLDNVSIRL